MMNRIASAICVGVLLAGPAIGGQTVFDITIPVINSSDPKVQPARPSRYVWTFESESGADVRWGYYADGVNRWVAPAVGDTGVRLVSLVDGEPSQVHFLHIDADPMPHDLGLLYENKIVNAGKDYPNSNAAQDEVPSLPKVYTPGAAGAISLVAGSERNGAEEDTGGTSDTIGGAMNSYMVVTVLAEPPPDNGANSIRPNIVGATKRFYTWDDVNLAALVSLPGYAAADASTRETHVMRWAYSTEVFSMVTWHGSSWRKYSEGGRAYRAHIVTPEYGTQWSAVYSAAVKLLMGANTVEEKKPVLAAMLSHGMDMWAHMFDTPVYRGAWSSGAGQSTGGGTPIYVFAALIDDAEIGDAVKRTVIDNWKAEWELQGPQELRQLMRGQTGVILWGDQHQRQAVSQPNLPFDSVRTAWANFTGSKRWDGCILAEGGWGKKTHADPHRYIDGPAELAGSQYMATTMKEFQNFAAMCVLWPAFGAVVNTTDPIEYADRIYRFGRWTSPDPVAPPTVAAQESILNDGCTPYNNEGACDDWRVLWGPSQSDWRYAIEDGQGRFQSRHGDPIAEYDPNYTFAGLSWAEIMAQYDGPRYEQRVNALGVCAAPDIYLAPSGGTLLAYMRSGTFDAVIHYETGADEASTATPTTSSPIFTGTPESPADLSGDLFVKAIAVKPGFADSAVASSSGQVTGGGTPPSPGGDNQPKRTRLRGSASGLLIGR